MSSRSRATPPPPTSRNRYVPCGRDGARVGIYIVSFYDCPHCMNLLSSYRFRLYADFIRRQYKLAVVRLVIQPKTYGLQKYEFIADEFDRRIPTQAFQALTSVCTEASLTAVQSVSLVRVGPTK